MANNKKLRSAKSAKNDEFYTQYSDISNECNHYRQHFRGKTIYCNCDDPAWSNFWKYFHSNFASLGLKRLISTHYQPDTEPSYAMIYEGGDDFNMDAGKINEIYGNTGDVNGKEVFYTAGDFRSDACIELLKESDIVVTNPPFSLFREYVAQLMEYDKKFIIIGNQNAVTYKEIFPLIKDNKIWYGASVHSGGIDFRMPDDYEEYSKNVFIKNGHHYINLAGIRWFTNMDVKYRHDGLWHKNGIFDNSQAHKYYEGNETKYPVYDNIDAINVDKTSDIPIDYPGVMGVPITWLDKYNPEEFVILGCTANPESNDVEKRPRSEKALRLIYEKRLIGAKCVGGNSNIFIDENNYVHVLYHRILIKNRHPIKKSDDLGY